MHKLAVIIIVIEDDMSASAGSFTTCYVSPLEITMYFVMKLKRTTFSYSGKIFLVLYAVLNIETLVYPLSSSDIFYIIQVPPFGIVKLFTLSIITFFTKAYF